MLTSPRPLDWALQSYVDRSVIWHPQVYNGFTEAPGFAASSIDNRCIGTAFHLRKRS